MTIAPKNLTARGLSSLFLLAFAFSFPAAAHDYDGGYWRPHHNHHHHHEYYGWQRPYYPPPVYYQPAPPRYLPPPQVVIGVPPVRLEVPLPGWQPPRHGDWR